MLNRLVVDRLAEVETEKRGSKLQLINTLLEGRLADLLIDKGCCPECTKAFLEKAMSEAGRLVHKDADIVCTSCGLVTSQVVNAPQSIPFGQYREPENRLDFGGGLGQTLSEKNLWVVLAKAMRKPYKCPSCGFENNDLPIRAQLIKNLCRFEHPKILTLLDLGSKRLEEWGFGDRKNKKNAVVSNYYGKMLRHLGAFMALSKDRVRPSKVADACFALCMHDLFGRNKFFEAMQKLDVNPKLYEEIHKSMRKDTVFPTFNTNAFHA
jgi:hypothetical protein